MHFKPYKLWWVKPHDVSFDTMLPRDCVLFYCISCAPPDGPCSETNCCGFG